MKRLSYLLSVLVLGVIGCGDGGAGEGDAGDGLPSLDSLAVETPAAANELERVSWNVLREPVTLDPIMSQTEAENVVVTELCDTLLRMTPEFEIVPGIAESYEMVDPTTWVYTIRDDVKFWDGTPLTVDDVVFSLNRSFSEATSYWPLYFERVESVKQTGDQEITIKLNEPYGMLNSELATLGGAIVQQKAVEDAGGSFGTPREGVMCSGPFSFDSWDPGQRITVTRNDDYWDPERLSEVGEIEFRFLGDDSTITSALSSGQVQGMYEVPVSGVTELRSATNGEFYLGPSTRMLSLVPTERRGPLAETAVRQALYLAMDQQAIASTIFGNAALPGKSVAAPTWGYSEDIFRDYYDSIPEPEADLEEAERLLRESGAEGERIILATDNSTAHTAVANSIQSAAEQVGLEVQVEVLTPAESEALFFDKKLRQDYDGFINSPFTFVPDPGEMGLYLLPDSYYNYGLYKNEEFTTLVEQALGEYDDDQRAETLVEAQRIIDEEVPWIPIVYQPVRTFMSSEITGASPTWSYMNAPWADGLGGAEG